MLLKQVRFTFIVSCIVSAALVSPVNAIEITPFTSIYSENIHGQFVVTGNTNQSCSFTIGVNASYCHQAQDFQISNHQNNDDFVMRDVEQPMANIASSRLFNASSSQVQFPRGSTIAKAYLFWFGTLETPSQAHFGIEPQNAGQTNQVLFSRPNEDCSGLHISQCLVTGSTFTESIGSGESGYYISHADVTARLIDLNLMNWTTVGSIQSAVFSVGNVQGAQGIGTSAGWSLLVVYENPNESLKHVDIQAGFGFIAPRSSQHITISDLQIPMVGDYKSSVGIVGIDGDAGTKGDSVTISNGNSSTVLTDEINPGDNIMNSSVSQDGIRSTYLDGLHVGRNKNTFGLEADRFDVTNLLPYGVTTAKASFTSVSDTYYLGAIAMATPIAGAQIIATKYVSNLTQGGVGSNSAVSAGDDLEYTIKIENQGDATAKGVSLSDYFDTNHLTSVQTSTAGCSVSANHLSCTNLGNLLPLSPPILVVATAKVNTGSGTISNFSSVFYDGDKESLSNTVSVAYGVMPVDLGLQLLFNPDFVQAGNSSQFSIQVTNYGINQDDNPKVELMIPAGLSPVTKWPSGCVSNGASLTCSGSAFGIDALNPLQPGENATLNVDVSSASGKSRYVVTGHVETSASDGDPSADNNYASATLELNHPPQASPAIMHAKQSGPIVLLDIATFIHDADGDSLHLTYDAPSNRYGIIRLSATMFSFKPSVYWHGKFSFKYHVKDGRGGAATSQIDVIVSPRTDDSSNGKDSNGQANHSKNHCFGFVNSGC